MSSIRGFPSPRHDHGTFEERRTERVNNLKAELKRESLPISNVSYYQTIEQQNQFLNSIENTHFGQSLVRLQHRFNVEMGIPLILPRFTNITNISVNEQRFLAMQGLRISKDRQGNYGIEISGLKRAYETIEQTNGKAGAYYQKGGAGYQEAVKQKRPERVFGVTPEPTVVTGVKPFEKPERVSVFQPKKTLSPQIKKIIDDWSVKKIIVPAWFANNNMNWVLEGRITEQEFLDAYTNLVNTGAITFTTPQVTVAPIPEITIPSIPEVSAEMELITTNFQVIIKDVTRYSTSLSNTDYLRLHDEMHYEKRVSLVFLNETDMKPLTTFYKELRKIQKLLENQVVETITISPTGQVITAPEPTVTPGKTGLMGAGVLGVIGILMLSGFIADHVMKRK